METSEYFVYCGVFKMRSWLERFDQIAKGEFSEVQKKKIGIAPLSDSMEKCMIKKKMQAYH